MGKVCLSRIRALRGRDTRWRSSVRRDFIVCFKLDVGDFCMCIDIFLVLCFICVCGSFVILIIKIFYMG